MIDTSFVAPPLQEEILRMGKRIERLEAALRPFAHSVFNDNGDVTVNYSATYDDYVRAYFAMRSK